MFPSVCLYACTVLVDILLIQSNIGTPADELLLCPGGQPQPESKREGGQEAERARVRERRGK